MTLEPLDFHELWESLLLGSTRSVSRRTFDCFPSQSCVHKRCCGHACMEHTLHKHKKGPSSNRDLLIKLLLRQMRLPSFPFQLLFCEIVSMTGFDLTRIRFRGTCSPGHFVLNSFPSGLATASASGLSWSTKSVQAPSRTCPCCNTCSIKIAWASNLLNVPREETMLLNVPREGKFLVSSQAEWLRCCSIRTRVVHTPTVRPNLSSIRRC